MQAGKKQSHWIWYIFPQMRGLGRSYFAQMYGICNREEAETYLNKVNLPEERKQILHNIARKLMGRQS